MRMLIAERRAFLVPAVIGSRLLEQQRVVAALGPLQAREMHNNTRTKPRASVAPFACNLHANVGKR